MSFDKYLLRHCSPTLACLKTANMFSCSYECEKNFDSSVKAWNEIFNSKGIELIVLKKKNNTALIYVCRKSRLADDLAKDGVAEFLAGYGYNCIDVDKAINTLRKRLLCMDGFPHEIGLFLDYPLDDVKGFISNAGANSKCAGCWKVYCNEAEAQKKFAQYKKCKEVYSRLYMDGKRDIMQLTVKSAF
mgnify:CR=1 FL=1